MADPVYTVELFTCLGCDETEQIAGSKEAPADEQARAKGWRFGITGSGDQRTYCPQCVGVNRTYWRDLPLGNGGGAGNAWGWSR